MAARGVPLVPHVPLIASRPLMKLGRCWLTQKRGKRRSRNRLACTYLYF